MRPLSTLRTAHLKHYSLWRTDALTFHGSTTVLPLSLRALPPIVTPLLLVLATSDFRGFFSSASASCVPRTLPLLPTIPQNSLHVARYPSLISAPVLSVASRAPNRIEDKTQRWKQKDKLSPHASQLDDAIPPAFRNFLPSQTQPF